MITGRPRVSRWLLREPAKDAAARLFCIPYSGCGASMYRGWPQAIGGVEICPVQPPGRENRMRDVTYSSYEELATGIIDALSPYFDRPFAFFGHCGSALPCYEIAIQLERRGGPVPDRLFVSSQVAPHHGPFGRFLLMPGEELAEEVKQLIRRMGGQPVPDLVELCLEVLRSDIEANKRYRRETPQRAPCAITALGWTRDSEVDARLMAGWSDCGATTFHVLEGEHYRFLEAPPALMAIIAAEMSAPSTIT